MKPYCIPDAGAPSEKYRSVSRWKPPETAVPRGVVALSCRTVPVNWMSMGVPCARLLATRAMAANKARSNVFLIVLLGRVGNVRTLAATNQPSGCMRHKPARFQYRMGPTLTSTRQRQQQGHLAATVAPGLLGPLIAVRRRIGSCACEEADAELI